MESNAYYVGWTAAREWWPWTGEPQPVSPYEAGQQHDDWTQGFTGRAKYLGKL